MTAAAAWLFYQSWTAALILSPLAIPYCIYRVRGEREKERRVLSGQFRELLGSVNNALRAGDSPENAFREGYREMVYEYGEYAPISAQMSRLVSGLDNRIPLEKLLEDFAARAGTEEIREFAEVFRIAKRGGGNMTEILSRTALLIEERLDVENEISIMLGNRRLEQRIMDITPFMIIFYIGITSPGFFDVLYHNAEGAAFMTLCLGAYLSALVLSEKILAVTMCETVAAQRRERERMEIYIYGMILAVYLVLWFVSRDSGSTGITGMAEYLYRKGKGPGRKVWPGRLFRENGIRRDLTLLYPYGKLEGEERQFYVGRIRLVLLILLAGDILAIAGYAAAGGNMLLGEDGLVRDEIGGEDRSTELDAYILQEDAGESASEGGKAEGAAADSASKEEDRVYQGSYRLEVRSRKFSEEQAQALADEVFAMLPDRIRGENESLRHVTQPLDLPVEIEGYPFQVAWESSSYALVDSNGTVGNLGMIEGENREVVLTAVLSYDNGIAGGLRYEREYPVTVFAPELSAEEKLSAQIKEAIQNADEKSAAEQTLPLPDEMEDKLLCWEEKPSGSGMSTLVFAAIVSFLAAAAMGSRLHGKVVERERQMMLDYPQIISKFVLYLGAGLSVRSTFIKIGEDYAGKRAEGMKERGAYEEILLVCRELAGGVSEAEAYANFGQRCRSRQYTRLSAILAQNLKKGNQEILSVMQQEAKASFEERQNTARKLGEEAETKLLLPMIMMLAITMLIIIIPAYYSFAA